MAKKAKKSAGAAKKAARKAPAKGAAKKSARRGKPAFNQVFLDHLVERVRFIEERVGKLEDGIGFPRPAGTPPLP